MEHDIVGGERGILRVVAAPVESRRGRELRVLAHDHFSGEPVGMRHDAPDQAAQQVHVRSSPLRPLVVDLEDHRVVRREDSLGTRGQRRNGGPVELEPGRPHALHQVLETDEAVPHRILRAPALVEDLGAVVLARGKCGALAGDGHDEAARPDPDDREGRCGDRSAQERASRPRDAAPEQDQRPQQTGPEARGRGRERGALAGIGKAARLLAAAQHEPHERQKCGHRPPDPDATSRLRGKSWNDSARFVTVGLRLKFHRARLPRHRALRS